MNNEREEWSTLGQVSEEVLRIEELLRALPVLGEITYQQIEEKTGVPVIARRHLLDSARKRLEREESILLDPIIGVGLRRLDDVQRVKKSTSYIPKMRRSAARGGGLLARANYDALPPEMQVRHNTNASVFTYMTYLLKMKPITALRDYVTERRHALSAQETAQATIEHFKK
jgi:hypothetical protein